MIDSDYIFHLASGTELSIEAAEGDLSRAIDWMIHCGEQGLAADLGHVSELLTQLQQGYHAPLVPRSVALNDPLDLDRLLMGEEKDA